MSFNPVLVPVCCDVDLLNKMCLPAHTWHKCYELTNCLLIGFEACSTGKNFLSGIAILIKSS